ncbi:MULTISPECIES: hypothetical protein [unclassified Methanoregula]|uniref:hypothetical protein n=1 Tax=unclassified Methanoregula TaxID=2649730 RepID=UPI0009C6E7E2|nr:MULTISPECIES: hypothetical protein [unclassified Methanoregula]OPX62535.1 MAG: Stigma-specific protein, Stig1 [Methanoregula sp. PtaB.Bin085]OPY31634.1 MAG: Stigma-specific protein, Stig1 [Methanoregula sp. PtaU1.Bin006]
MKNILFLCVFCILLIAAAPAGAAALTSVTACPSSCSCLLPAEAAKIGSPGYCNDKPQICAADSGGVQKYCYGKTAVKSPAIRATLVVVATTTAVPQACAAGCSCLSPEDAKAKNLPYCGGKQTLCSGTPGQDPRYCFAPADTAAARTTTQAVAAIKPGTTLVAVPAGTPSGTPVLPAVSARVLATTSVPATTTSAVVADPGILAGIGSIFGSLLGTPSSSTSSRMISCNGTLTDIMTDAANCGGCGLVCPDGPCVMGSCRDTGGRMTLACSAREVLCNGVCTDIWFNESTCGNCTNTCRAGEACCSGECVNLSSNWHCGSCSNVCHPSESSCSGGVCQCYRNRTLCGDGYCYDLQNDHHSCGTCGHECREGEICCSGVCSDTETDSRNCGECGRACGEDTDICVRGECQDTTHNRDHCGGRNIVCSHDEWCCMSQCINLTAPESCGACGSQVVCPAGNLCCEGVCTEQDRKNCGACGEDCFSGEHCCDGKCMNLDSHDNCGTCNHACSWYEVCDPLEEECHNGWDDFWEMVTEGA